MHTYRHNIKHYSFYFNGSKLLGKKHDYLFIQHCFYFANISDKEVAFYCQIFSYKCLISPFRNYMDYVNI